VCPGVPTSFQVPLPHNTRRSQSPPARVGATIAATHPPALPRLSHETAPWPRSALYQQHRLIFWETTRRADVMAMACLVAGPSIAPGHSRRRTAAAAPRTLASSRTRAVSPESASTAPAAPGTPPAPSRSEGEATERVKGVYANDLTHMFAVLAEDLTHLFDDVGVDTSLYEPDVCFEAGGDTRP